MAFQLHRQLQNDSHSIGRFELCRVLLLDDSQFPWVLLVPEVESVHEIYQLSSAQRQQLIEESSYLAEQLNRMFQADKINIAAIGNVVPQLHVHHVVRYRTDKAWPAPVWGKLPLVPYLEHERNDRIKRLQETLVWLRRAECG